MFWETVNHIQMNCSKYTAASASICIKNVRFDVESLGQVKKKKKIHSRIYQNHLVRSGGWESSEDKYFPHFCHGFIRRSIRLTQF